ncbi:MAG TPA: ATP-dependent Clp protease proteolytic subunit [Acidimicrobiales bacterium]|nr:ATP-dependent Clp protease proteolytic subunit [Acidimicrobiales bacterium]
MTMPHLPNVPSVFTPNPVNEELAERLMERRIVRVAGPLDLLAVNDASARLMLLDATGDDPIDLVLSCPDGDLTAAMALADTVEILGVELRATCAGALGGVALMPYAVAPRRLAHEHATFRLVNPRQTVMGFARNLADAVEHELRFVAEFHKRFARATGHTVAEVEADFDRGRFLTAGQAVGYGLVDEIVRKGGSLERVHGD